MDNSFADSEEVYAWLLGFVNVEKGQATVFKLDRMRALAQALGSPEGRYRCVHIAGSKGKGSVSTMIARILAAAGHRVGLYTSPHLLHWKERIALADAEIEDAIIAEAAARLRRLVEGKVAADFPGDELPTYFELSTLVAFETFRLAGCDIAVIETGLGGRLDSTNIVEPELSVITPLELEHTEWLGDSIEKIAFEKAGIIKTGKPVCISAQLPAARAVLEKTASERGSRLYDAATLVRIEDCRVGRRGTWARLSFEGSWPFGRSLDLSTPLVGKVQARNMGQAILAAALVEPGLDAEAVRSGLARVRLPARFELISEEPPVVLDGAHTPASVSLALATFEDLFPGPKLLLFACAIDKHHAEMAGILGGHFDDVIVTRPGSFKTSDPEAVFASFSAVEPRTRLIEDPLRAFDAALEKARNEGMALLVTGSFYLCAEAAARFPGGD
ncbi:MAG TPA: folylpolyglutamate synthase/dihydrofolate synthase family protein [Rectinemataceae bacterium]|nr:folylpolyglutamate synthase/dihydrofolate synthase family protein [Rectinemataceae bacterium]